MDLKENIRTEIRALTADTPKKRGWKIAGKKSRGLLKKPREAEYGH